MSSSDDAPKEKPTKPRQKNSERIPSRPTEGWMRHELEANGIRAIGVPMKIDRMIDILRDLGYDVT